MTKKLLTCLAAALAIGAIATPAASAATTIGNPCVGDVAEPPPSILVQLSQTTSSMPLVAPESGVVTRWGVSVIAYEGGISEKLKVLRPAPGPNTFTVVGESSLQPIAGGTNSFETRVPIQAGDRIGAVANIATIYCKASSAPTDVMAGVAGDQAVNSSAAYTEVPGAQAAVTATIEPDADKDGFGDETQDKCPQNAAFQIPCPVLKLKALSFPPGKGAIRVLVAADGQASITISASAKVPKKGKGTKLTRLSPVVQLVSPGEIIVYTINFNKTLKDALKALPRKKSIKLEIVAAGQSLGGATTTERLTARLKGQAKPAPKAQG